MSPVHPVRCLTIRLFLATTAVSRDSQEQCEIAVNQCRKDSEYISSIDADDLMLPYALERMIQIMKQENATVGLHGYLHQDPIISHDKLLENLVKDQYLPMQVSAHHGHITVARSSWIAQKEQMKRGQDSEHVIRLWKAKNRLVYTREKLTNYIKRPMAESKQKKLKVMAKREKLLGYD